MAKTYKMVAMMVDGKETAKLDCFKEGNIFSVFENDTNVFSSSSYIGYDKFIKDWVAKWSELAEMLSKSGHKVEFIR